MDDRVSTTPPFTVSDAGLPDSLAPYRQFNREEWSELRADMPLTLTAGDIAKLRSLNDPMSLDEVEAIYLPLSRLLSLYVAATQGLYQATRSFLMAPPDGKAPYIIGLAGSVSAGKSTTARLLQALLSRWSNTPRVALVTTDGFLHPNAVLKERGLMERKGFPESYDGSAIVRFLSRIKSGDRNVTAPVYSHLVYDIVAGAEIVIDRPDILIFEGLNVLQPPKLEKDGRQRPSCPTSSIFRSIWTRMRTCCGNGTSNASCVCGRPPSAIRRASSAAMPN